MRALWLLAMLFLTSCAAEEFTVSSLSMNLEREAVIAESISETDTLSLSASFSMPENTYTFRLVSPDGDLSWEGAFTGSDEVKTSENLEITPNAAFQKGEYSIIIYSDNGTEVKETLSLSYDDGLRHFESGILSGSAYVSEMNEGGEVIAEGRREKGYSLSSGTASAEIEYQDSYGQSVSITEFFPPSDEDPSL